MLELPLLGASLYVPTTHHGLDSIAAFRRLTDVRSIIFCTEDSVSLSDLKAALVNLSSALQYLRPVEDVYRFVRVRNPDVLKQILAFPGSEYLDGFVFPKSTADNIESYMQIMLKMGKLNYWVMPTLETREIFNDSDIQKFLRKIDKARWRDRILCLRIGGNDLLSLLKLRRPRGCTIYETPVGNVIARLATTFIPYDYTLSAPVFEYLDDEKTLNREIELDLNYGLIGKTAIHPSQVPVIERHYQANNKDIEAALHILENDAPAVFKFHQSMCEPATHRPWARSVLRAANCFGCANAD